MHQIEKIYSTIATPEIDIIYQENIYHVNMEIGTIIWILQKVSVSMSHFSQDDVRLDVHNHIFIICITDFEIYAMMNIIDIFLHNKHSIYGMNINVL
jgi:hypothetical protein